MRKTLFATEFVITMLLLTGAVALAPYCNITWVGGGLFGAALLLATGIISVLLFVGPVGNMLLTSISTAARCIGLFRVLCFGVLIQIVVALATDPSLESDGRVYMLLAQRLAKGAGYIDEAGHRAFWPPGLSFFLIPFVTLFVNETMATTAANITLYVVGACAAWSVGKQLFNVRVGVLSALIFTIWPSRLLCAGLVSKENFTVGMVLLALAFCIAAFRRLHSLWWLFALGAGASYGAAALAQPGLLLFVFIVPLVYRQALDRLTSKQFLGRYLVTMSCAVISSDAVASSELYYIRRTVLRSCD